jgi:Tfp pilus assembly protein PilO
MEDRNFILTIFFILASFFLFLFFLFPHFQNFFILQSELKFEKKLLKAKEDYFKNIQNLLSELKTYQNELDKIDVALPKDPFLPETLNLLEKKCREKGLDLKKISSSPSLEKKEKEGSLEETTVELSLYGNYRLFKDFLSELEKSARFIEVEKISLSPSKEGGIDFDLVGKIYHY